MVPSGNLTVRPPPVEAASVAASRANAPDEVTKEQSVAQSPLNSRRFSSLVFLLFTNTIPSTERRFLLGRERGSADNSSTTCQILSGTGTESNHVLSPPLRFSPAGLVRHQGAQ